MTTSGVFVTGTDTGVGKTVVCVALLRALVAGGVRAVGMKPIAAGFDEALGVNADVAALAAAGNVDAPLADRNPYAFSEPIAPHVAAHREGATIDLERVAQAYARLAARADVVVVEGAGGPLVPIGPRHDMLDIPRRLALPVVLVVGVRLGCLSHALSAELAVRARGLRLAGWIATRVDPAMAQANASVAALRERLPAPLLADLAGADAPIPREALRLAGLPGETC
ncbi:MAG TPA: dethiobiotin synthase [Casimicrobiaceae bacterium]